MVLKSLIVRDIFQLCYYTVSPPKKSQTFSIITLRTQPDYDQIEPLNAGDFASLRDRVDLACKHICSQEFVSGCPFHVLPSSSPFLSIPFLLFPSPPPPNPPIEDLG